MKKRDKYGRFAGNKYFKIDGVWFKGRCNDCGKLVKGHDTKRCKECNSHYVSKEMIAGRRKRPIHDSPHTKKSKKLISRNRQGKGLHPGTNYGQTWERHPRFIDGSWSYRRRTMKQGRLDKCERCGKSEKLHVHHKDRDRRNNNDENLEVLCTMCHMHEHKNWEKRIYE